MKYNFPRVTLSEPQKLWLDEVYAISRTGQKVSTRRIYQSLMGKVPPDFNGYDIDRRLLKQGNELTLLGFWHSNPDDEIFNQVDALIKFMRERFLLEPDREIFECTEISGATKMDEEKIVKLFELLSDLNFWGNIQTIQNSTHKKVLIMGDDPFRKYINYQGLDLAVKQAFELADPNRNIEVEKLLYPIEVREPVQHYVPNSAFILMWMDSRGHEELEDVSNVIKEVCSDFNIKADRADDIQHEEKITDVILDRITTSEFLIGDLTGERPNVYYEIGYAHALNKRPILFRRKGTRLHFDLSVHNVPEYRNITELKNLLTIRFQAIMGSEKRIENQNWDDGEESNELAQ